MKTSPLIADLLVADSDGSFLGTPTITDLIHSWIDDSDYLSHYGVLGMKWGVRKDKRSRSSRKSAATSARLEIQSLDDDALRQRIWRVEQEQKLYNMLTTKKKSPVKKFVGDILVNSGKAVLTRGLTTAGNIAVDNLLKKALPKGVDIPKVDAKGRPIKEEPKAEKQAVEEPRVETESKKKKNKSSD